MRDLGGGRSADSLSGSSPSRKWRLWTRRLASAVGHEALIQTGNSRFPLKGSFKGDIDIDIWLTGLLLRNLVCFGLLLEVSGSLWRFRAIV